MRSDAFCENIVNLQPKFSKSANPKMFDTLWVERYNAILFSNQLKPSIEDTKEYINYLPLESYAFGCCRYLASMMLSEFLIALILTWKD